MRKFISLVVTAALGVLSLLVLPNVATAADLPGGRLVSEVAASGTPHVLDGRVYSVVQVGDMVVLGGTFTSARNDDDSQTTLTRNGVLAFSATTGKISTTFNPAPNGAVNVVLPAADGASVYVAGRFASIGGVARTNLAKVRVSDGAVNTTFNAGYVAGKVEDLRLKDGRLWVAGGFTHIAGKAQRALATVNPDTGAFQSFMRASITGVHNGGYTTVVKMDISPDGSRLVAVGNFDSLNGVRNHQLVMLNLSGTSATQANFQTDFYTTPCSSSFDSYMRDIDFSPDGTFFVVSTTGAYGGSDAACDTTARFDVASTGTLIAPSWVNTTGGDTTYGVEITDSVVYVGGHMRWQNNSFRADAPGPGAVSRPGIAALSPSNGLPFSWNPTRTRGVGLFDFLSTDRGLWATSDTDRIGNYQYKGRIALLGTAGKQFPTVSTPTLPNDIYLAGAATASSTLVRRSFQNTTAGSDVPVPTGGVNWTNVKGAFMVNGNLYTAMSDGPEVSDYTFTRRTFDGTSYGPAVLANTQDLITPLTDWKTDIQRATGMFLDSGRLYFTRSDSNQLFYRYFNPESDVVGAKRFVASNSVTGLDFSKVTGMFNTGTKLYWSTSDNILRSIDWVNRPQAGVPVGPITTVPGTAGWSSRAMFLFQGADGAGAGAVPTASFTSNCTALTCSFDASGSTVTSGSIRSYDWSFGDGGTATGVRASHSYAANGTFTVTLTVTADNGASDVTTRQVDVTSAAAATITQVGANSSNGNRSRHAVAVPVATAVGDTLVAFLTTNSTNSTVNAAPAGWSLVESRDGTGLRARAWTKTATASDLGSDFAVTTSAYAKSDLSITVYRASTGVSSVTASASAVESGKGLSHSTPGVDVAEAGSWVVSYWSRKAADTSPWNVPAGQVERTSSTGSGSGNIAALLTDPNSPRSAAGPAGGVTATTIEASSQVAMFSVVIGAGGATSPPPPAEPDTTTGEVSQVAATSVNANRTTHTVPVPSTTRAGDAVVVLLTTNSTNSTINGAPAGWILTESRDSNGVRARAWTKTATAGDLGSSFVIGTSATTKADLSIAVYRSSVGTPTVTASSSSAVRSESGNNHTTPTVNVPTPGSWVVSYWARKASNTATWTIPNGQTLRSTSAGTGSGNIAAILTDGNAPQAAGFAGGLTASTSESVGTVAMFSLVIGQK